MAAAELAAAVPGSVAVDVDDLLAEPPDEPDDAASSSLLLAAREPSTPPTTAAMMTASRSGRPIHSHLLRFFFSGGA